MKFLAVVVGTGKNPSTLGAARAAESLDDAIGKGVKLARELANPPLDNPTESIEQWEETVRATLAEDFEYEGERPDGETFVVAVGVLS